MLDEVNNRTPAVRAAAGEPPSVRRPDRRGLSRRSSNSRCSVV